MSTSFVEATRNSGLLLAGLVQAGRGEGPQVGVGAVIFAVGGNSLLARAW